jgi:hypothetical protein
MKRLWLIVGSLAAIGLVVIVVMLLAPKPPVPVDVKRAVTSTILVPQAREVDVSRESMAYNSQLKLLSFTTVAFGVKAVVSEQPTPESFIDIPQVYDKVVTNMNEYSKFDSDSGTVHLTRPKDLGGKQAAVMNAKGTLMFVKPERDLSDDQWRKLFNGLEVIK